MQKRSIVSAVIAHALVEDARIVIKINTMNHNVQDAIHVQEMTTTKIAALPAVTLAALNVVEVEVVKIMTTMITLAGIHLVIPHAMNAIEMTMTITTQDQAAPGKVVVANKQYLQLLKKEPPEMEALFLSRRFGVTAYSQWTTAQCRHLKKASASLRMSSEKKAIRQLVPTSSCSLARGSAPRFARYL